MAGRRIVARNRVCAKCGRRNHRAPQSYCGKCHRAYQADYRRKRVWIPYAMLTLEQRAWLAASPRRARKALEA